MYLLEGSYSDSAPLPFDASAVAIEAAVSGMMGPACQWDDNAGIYHYDHDTFDNGISDQWQPRNYVTPKVTNTGGSFCGGAAQHFASDGTHGGSWGRNFENAGTAWDTETFKYMCMGTRIPPSTTLNMLVYVTNSDGKNNGWKSISLNQCSGSGCSYKEIATWNKDINGNVKPIEVDNAWHYRCINVDEQLDQNLGYSTHKIKSLMFHRGTSANPSGEFWIDEFSISSHPRSPTRTVHVPVAAVGVVETAGRTPFVTASPGNGAVANAMMAGSRVALRGRHGVYVYCPATGAIGSRCETSEEPMYFTVTAAKRGGFGDGRGLGDEDGRVELSTPHGTLLSLSVDRKTVVQIDGSGGGEGSSEADFTRRSSAQLRLVHNSDGTVFIQSRDFNWLTSKELPALVLTPTSPSTTFSTSWTDQRFTIEPEPLQCRAPMRALIGGVGSGARGIPDSALKAKSVYHSKYGAANGRFGSHEAWLSTAADKDVAWFQADVGAGTAAGVTVHEVWVSGRGCCGNDYIKTFTLSYLKHGSSTWEAFKLVGFPSVAANAGDVVSGGTVLGYANGAGVHWRSQRVRLPAAITAIASIRIHPLTWKGNQPSGRFEFFSCSAGFAPAAASAAGALSLSDESWADPSAGVRGLSIIFGSACNAMHL